MDSDQIDGGGLSHGKKKEGNGKRLDPWERSDLPIIQTDLSAPSPTDNPTIISIGPHRWPTVSVQDHSYSDERSRKGKLPEAGLPMEEMENRPREHSKLNTTGERNSLAHHCHVPGRRIDCKPDDVPPRSFQTFKPSLGSDRRTRDSASSSGSSKTGGNTNGPNGERSKSWISNTDPHPEFHESLNFISEVEGIEQQIACENIGFVRFEATDLHGVSRSKTVPASLFREKALYGVPMPRSYLELTLSPKESEVDSPISVDFNGDILLIPDLSTYRALPWAEQTARIICDPCTVTGAPLRTSPRLIAKMMLGQLRAAGISMFSSFTYECCIFGVSEQTGPSVVLFPATTLLSNHDMPFLQQLVRGMYHMGIGVDSFASASGPGQTEICFKPKFGIEAADSAFTFRTGVKEMARKNKYIATFLTDDTMYNSGCLSHSIWDASGRRNLFHSSTGEISEIAKKWLGGLLHHSPALSCLMVPGPGLRTQHSKGRISKSTFYATCGCNDNSCTFNVKVHGGREAHIENKLGSAAANPYVVLAATIAAGMDGIKRNLCAEQALTKAPLQQKHFAIPAKLEDALVALEEDSVIRGALGEAFVRYFIAMKHLEIEMQESDSDRDKNLEYFI